MRNTYPEDKIIAILKENPPFQKTRGAGRLLHHLRLVSLSLLFILVFSYGFWVVFIFGADKKNSLAATGKNSAEVLAQNLQSETTEAETPAALAAVPDYEEISKKIRLTGIITGDKPQAIFEDRETHDIYRLCQGDSYSGMTVLEIKEGKVIVDAAGKRSEFLL